MDFFERQEIARRHTRWLQVYFALAVMGTVAALYLAAVVLLGFRTFLSSSRYYDTERFQGTLWDPQLFLGIAGGTLAVIVGGFIYKTWQLAGGGAAVAESLGGRPIPPNTSDPDQRKFLNVVEEMAIASGTPLPRAYFLPGVACVNAFAAGHTPADAVLCVTEGALRKLGRDELQGAVAHEFSHILNGDMRLNLRLMGIIFGILCLTLIGRVLVRARGRNAGGAIAAGLILLLVGSIGAFFARLIKAAVNRQREFLADAAAVQFTRNPSGLADALKKGAHYGSVIGDANSEDASHLFFLNGMPDSPFAWVAMPTHPPVRERIRELDPAWDGQLTSTTPSSEPETKPIPAWPRPAALPFSAQVGTVTPSHLDYAADLKARLPEILTAAAREPMGAVALVYALLLDPGETSGAAQLQGLPVDAPLQAETRRILPAVRALDSRAKLPLVTLSLAALRTLSEPQYRQFAQAIDALIQHDGQVDLFEYVLQKIVRSRIAPQFAPLPKTTVQYYDLAPLLPECALLLSALAYAGQDDPARVETAFRHGADCFPAGLDALELLDASAYDLGRVDAVLDRLNQAAAPIKKRVLDACAAVVTADGNVQEGEAELLRAIADTLGCPAPPFLD